MILSEEEKEEVLKNMYGASWKELLKIKQNEKRQKYSSTFPRSPFWTA